VKVAAFDLSLTQTGFAVVHADAPMPGGVHVENADVGTIRASSTGMLRLDYIRKQVLQRADGAHLVVLEGYAYGQARGTSQAHSMGEIGGVIRLSLWRQGIPFVDIAPAKLKKYATGKGNAGKDEMLASAIRRLAYEGANNNEADALWLLHMGLDAYGRGWAALPQGHRLALSGVPWPPVPAAMVIHA
jgi:crossover junction endodeoxyribonuclease RuvC